MKYLISSRQWSSVFFRHVAVAPAITFQFAYEVYARSENKNTIVFEIFLNARYARKHILVYVWVCENSVFVKKLRYAFQRRQSFLISRGIDKRAYPSVAVFPPADLLAFFLDFSAVIFDVFSRLEMFGNDVNVIVVIHAIPMRREGIVKPGVDRNIALPVERHVERVDDVNVFVEFVVNKPGSGGKLVSRQAHV